MKFDYAGGLLYGELSVFYESEVRLIAMIDTLLGAVIDNPKREIIFTK